MSELRAGPATLTFGDVTHVMAVINLSPESKNPHSIASGPAEALDMASRYRELGATIIDVGGQSSHYDNPTIPESEELSRLLPTVERLVAGGFVVSIDTWKPAVAAACVREGAGIVNDTGGLARPEMRQIVRDSDAAAIVMYVEGEHPHDVGEIAIGGDKASITADWMRSRLEELASSGVTRTIVDPGIAINYRGDYAAYTKMQLDVIRRTDQIAALGRPVLIPIPRKREDHRVAAYITMALEYEADIIRVHDVPEACDLVALFGRTVATG